MKELNLFVEAFAEEFEEEVPGSVKAETELRNLKQWSSLMALVVIVKIDELYGITLDEEDLGSVKTVGELFRLVEKRRKEH